MIGRCDTGRVLRLDGDLTSDEPLVGPEPVDDEVNQRCLTVELNHLVGGGWLEINLRAARGPAFSAASKSETCDTKYPHSHRTDATTATKGSNADPPSAPA